MTLFCTRAAIQSWFIVPMCLHLPHLGKFATLKLHFKTGVRQRYTYSSAFFNFIHCYFLGCLMKQLTDNVLTSLLYGMISTLIARFMGPIWDRQDPDGPHVGPMTSASWVFTTAMCRHPCGIPSQSHGLTAVTNV